jgi:hypothetical protein
MMATLRRETCCSADSSEDATSFITSLLLSRYGPIRILAREKASLPTWV